MNVNKYVKNKKLSSLLKYPGGKESELKYILQLLPTVINNYYEPFLGGGSVYLSIKTDKYFVNDKSAVALRIDQVLVLTSEVSFVWA